MAQEPQPQLVHSATMQAGNTVDPFLPTTTVVNGQSYTFGPNERKVVPGDVADAIVAADSRIRKQSALDTGSKL